MMQVDLPEEKPITHDGRTVSFGAFWSLFELRILKNGWLDDDSNFEPDDPLAGIHNENESQ